MTKGRNRTATAPTDRFYNARQRWRRIVVILLDSVPSGGYDLKAVLVVRRARVEADWAWLVVAARAEAAVAAAVADD